MNILVKSKVDIFPITRTRGGAFFDPNDDLWTISEGHLRSSLNFYELDIVTDKFLLGFKKTLIWYAENNSLRHFENMFKRTLHFVRFTSINRSEPIQQITSIDLLNYHAAQQEETKWYLGALAGFLKRWNKLGHVGVSDDAVKCLNELRLRGNAKGTAVLTMDPNHGPFTDIEFEAIQVSLNQAFEDERIDTADFVLVRLFLLLGQRPVQYAMLKVCDVIEQPLKDGSKDYILRIPRAKQRTVARANFSERLITPQFGIFLFEYAKSVQADFDGILDDCGLAPLFPQLHNTDQPPMMEFHTTSSRLGARLKQVVDGLEIYSERTGEPLNITATRFRRSTGTRAAQEGHGEQIIASLLDHSDTQNAGVYVQATPEIIERIDRAMATNLAPLAQAFAGIIISDEREATRKNDPASRIFDARLDSSCKSMGSCGKTGFCGFAAPIACYTCPSFQAWIDGPHESVLDHLLAERERKIEISDRRIASIHDRTILAVADVIRQCKELKSQEPGGDHV